MVRRLKGLAEASEVDDFRKSENEWLLILDKNGEDGLNLAFALGIIHYDLPFSASRIEQRIGRLDRFGRQSYWKEEGLRYSILNSIILTSDQDESPWFKWYNLLKNEFNIFQDSISDIQFWLKSFEDYLFQTLFLEGSGEKVWEKIKTEVENNVKLERRRLDAQYLLEKTENEEADSLFFQEALEELEESQELFRESLNTWLGRILSIQISDNKVFNLSIRRNSRIPFEPWGHNMALSLVDRKLTYSRDISTLNNETSLLRLGDPFINLFEKYYLYISNEQLHQDLLNHSFF